VRKVINSSIKTINILEYGQDICKKRVKLLGYMKGEESNQIILFPESIDEYNLINNPIF